MLILSVHWMLIMARLDPRAGHLDRGRRRHRPGRRGLGDRVRRRPDGPRRETDPADRRVRRVGRCSASPISSSSSSAWDPGRSPASASASSAPRCWPRAGLRPARRLFSLDVLAAPSTGRSRRTSWWRPMPGGTSSTGPATALTRSGRRTPGVDPGRRCPSARRRTGVPTCTPTGCGQYPGPRFLDPGVLALAGPGLPDAGHEPLYLRRPDATESDAPQVRAALRRRTAMTQSTHNPEVQHPRRASR